FRSPRTPRCGSRAGRTAGLRRSGRRTRARPERDRGTGLRRRRQVGGDHRAPGASVAVRRRRDAAGRRPAARGCARNLGRAGLGMIESDEQRQQFERDGFVVVDELIDAATVERLRERFEPLFTGEWATGIKPDEVNWLAGRDPEDRTRQICNGWKADPTIAAQVLSERSGRLAAELMGWDGIRLGQDNCIWKPPGTKALGMHQDGSYLDYLVPPEMITCWITLDDTAAEAGTITYAAGSHCWPRSAENRGEFHAPADWLAPVRRAVPDGV